MFMSHDFTPGGVGTTEGDRESSLKKPPDAGQERDVEITLTQREVTAVMDAYARVALGKETLGGFILRGIQGLDS
jgi:hypothetical protein